MRLGAFLYPTGYHVAAWRHADVPADAGVNFAHYAELARTAERGTLDFLFLPDSSAMRGDDLTELSRTAIRYVAQFEPLTLLGALAAVTERIGLTATVSSTYSEPYHAARMIASLDHISRGRAGWNLVTSQNPYEAYNFGLPEHPDHAARYRRAHEFAEVVKGLWDTWGDDAWVRDKEAGLFFAPERIRPLDHQGEHFSVRGPLNMPRTPQGHPVTLQAGSSEVGRELAAVTADVVFTAQHDKEDVRAFTEDVRARAEKNGRDPSSVLVMAGVFPFVGRTRAEAEEKRERLQDLIDPTVGLALLASELGHVDLSGCDPDGPLPELPPSNSGRSRRDLLARMAADEGLSIRQLYKRVAGSRGHRQVLGTAESVADELADWYESGVVDGFIVMPPSLPDGLDDFVDLVVPELRRRGLFRTAYEGTTLRDHLGLERPVR
ncbi:NtaA/DmoA family FMN-dependent monooxygenase [Streptomyces sp. SID486]|uniref:LLM class flavin-dependent oxidoreductase n=1 Tax=unclassified Streptomyces TaxID=2593676 RepID=UPI00136C8CCD|nr:MULTISPECIES: LLM class flavin-dependent oxidoreductase [unclassified Streptomyces]MYW45708.1 NtaA/DmoA family FMN-dependent monooxygenase [Streptomyces sp. SID161]MYX97486.1 NtaA/DmoA family FMN-dependent monooxygenase [Streptomyces sp. SID486]